MAGKRGNKGKGTGQHAARKAKYAAHSAGALIKGKNKKQRGGVITMRNKAARALKHQRLMAKQQNRAQERSAMLTLVQDRFPNMKLGSLQKKFGTLNIRRMTDILSGDFEQASWYLARIARRQALAERARMVRKHVKFRKRTKAEKRALAKSESREEIQDVSQRSNQRNRETQVDHE